ncbi:MAG: ABC transporter permease [Peptococcaceae bacterium]|nr:ABC transporter permease [Peptococcaceae bacterium]
MTSSSLSTKIETKAGKRGVFLMHSLRSYWWIAVICSVVYGFAGPVFTMLKLDSITSGSYVREISAGELLMQTQMKQMVRWFRQEGFVPLYFSAIVLAAVIGCVMFFYLQQKKQVNFYHSQPITRTRLFLNQYAAGLILNIVPLLVMIAVSFVVVAAYGMGSIINIGAILQHTLYMLLFLLASYSIAVFAGQLAGTMATHMAINAVLHFGVPLAAWIVNLMYSLFFATYNGAPIIENCLKFSPFCAAFQYLGEISYQGNSYVMTTEAMAGSVLAAQIGMTVLLSAASWFLYQKRPSEAAGKAMVYPVSEPILKAYLMFIVGIAAGLVFQAVGSRMFFYFAVITFAILTHMTCEVIIQHDFKAMGKRLSHCAVILVLILAVVGVFRFDLLGYDSYLPEPDEVQQVSLVVPGAEQLNNYGDDGNFTQDEDVKQGVYNLLQPIVNEKLYRSSDFDGNQSPYDYMNQETTSITVQYRMKNGDVKSRIYRAVTAESIEENYKALYNQNAYREAVYADLLQARPEDVYHMAVNNTSIYDQDEDAERRVIETTSTLIEGEIVVTTEAVSKEYPEKDLQNYDTMVSILEAYKQDVRNRQFDALKTAQKYTIEVQLPHDQYIGYYGFNMPVYEDDVNTMAILNQMDIDKNERNFSDALIFRCEEKTEAELRDMLNVAYNLLEEDAKSQKDIDNMNVERCMELLSSQAELTGHISGVEQVNQFIQESDLLSGSGIFAEFDSTHFVLLRYNHTGSNDWQNQLFYKGTVPAQYQ